MYVTILGKRWRFEWFSRPHNGPAVGWCDPPHAKNKVIRVASNQSEFDQLDTIVHELMHAADWTKKEEWVNQFGTDMARALWKLGYRRLGDDP